MAVLSPRNQSRNDLRSSAHFWNNTDLRNIHKFQVPPIISTWSIHRACYYWEAINLFTFPQRQWLLTCRTPVFNCPRLSARSHLLIRRSTRSRRTTTISTMVRPSYYTVERRIGSIRRRYCLYRLLRTRHANHKRRHRSASNVNQTIHPRRSRLTCQCQQNQTTTIKCYLLDHFFTVGRRSMCWPRRNTHHSCALQLVDRQRVADCSCAAVWPTRRVR